MYVHTVPFDSCVVKVQGPQLNSHLAMQKGGCLSLLPHYRGNTLRLSETSSFVKLHALGRLPDHLPREAIKTLVGANHFQTFVHGPVLPPT